MSALEGRSVPDAGVDHQLSTTDAIGQHLLPVASDKAVGVAPDQQRRGGDAPELSVGRVGDGEAPAGQRA